MKDMKWKILSSEYLIKRPWLTARRDVVELPDGRINKEYYVLEYPMWINVTAITQDGQMVLVRQYRHALGQTNFEIVAGVVEQGESPIEAAKRELLEEAGYGGGDWKEIAVVSANPSTTTNLTHSFLATGVEKVSQQHLDVTEDIEVFLFSQEEVKEMIRRGEFVQSLMLVPLLKYFSGL